MHPDTSFGPQFAPPPAAAAVTRRIAAMVDERTGDPFAVLELGSAVTGVVARAELTPAELAQHMADCRFALTAMAAHAAGANVVAFTRG